jgi:nicotinate-nucleotide pyrophosphorylase (carboxylating)
VTKPGVRAVETRPAHVPPALAEEIERVVTTALAEDVGPGDLTTEAVVPPSRRARGRLIAKAAGTFCGRAAFVRVFERLDPTVRVEEGSSDGEVLQPGDTVLALEGEARALLIGERTALNLVQRLSGIATLTARFVAAARPARVLDTRKTTPGLRALEKYAVACGGGENHRHGLFDAAMVKNNHLDVAGSDLGALLATLRARYGPRLHVTAEARDEREALAAVAGDADVVLLDNFSPARLAALCPRLRAAASARARPLALEASGGITLENAAAYAATGVERLSIGALTHSAPALDLSLRLEPLP